MHPLFFHFKPKWKASNDVWFTTFLIGQNELWFIVNRFIVNSLELKYKVLFNKIENDVGITHMEEVLFPQEYGTKVTRHWDLIHITS